MFSSPGLAAQYPDNVLGTAGAVNVNALVRLKQGEAGIDEFEREFTQVTGIDNAEFQSLVRRGSYTPALSRRSRPGCCCLVSLVALLAAMVLVGVAISRYCATSFANLEVLRAFGLAPTQTLSRRCHRTGVGQPRSAL